MLLPIAAALLCVTQPDPGVVKVRSDHAQIVVGDERYRLVAAQAPMSAVIPKVPDGYRLSVYVVRIGPDDEVGEKGTPIVVTVGKRKHVFPNRPRLVDARRITRLGGNRVASRPVRYPLKVRGKRNVRVRVALRKARDDGEVGIRLVLEPRKASMLAPLTPMGEAKARTSGDPKRVAKADKPRKKSKKRRRRRAKVRKPEPIEPDEEAPPEVNVDVEEEVRVASARRAPPDAGPALSRADGGHDPSGDDDDSSADAGEMPGGEETEATADAGLADAGPPVAPTKPAVAERPNAPPPARLRVIFVDNMGGLFALEGRTVEISGQEVAAVPLGSTKEAVLFDGPLPPGQHTVYVQADYRGDGGWFFTYLDGYHWHLADGALVELRRGETMEVRVTGHETGTWFTEMEDRPGLKVESRQLAR